MSEEEKDGFGGKGSAEYSRDGQDYGRKRSEVHITWDEETIAEHDKLRGTRQKIDEPSTPYHYGSESSQGSDCESADGKGPSSISSTPNTGSSPADSPHERGARRNSASSDKRGSILKVMADVSAALPSESALRRERQARWDSDVSENSATEDKEKARKFKAHREAHYNEFRALREWRAKKGKGQDDMDDSDSDSNDTRTDMAEERRRRRAGGAGSSSGNSSTSSISMGSTAGGLARPGGGGASSSSASRLAPDGMELDDDEDNAVHERKPLSVGVVESKSSEAADR